MGTCNHCRFAVRGAESEAHLYCHRNPPHAVVITKDASSGISFPFPAVAPSQGCGKFRRSLKRLFRGHVQARA